MKRPFLHAPLREKLDRSRELGIPEVVDNPTHDFEKMQKLAETV